MDTSILKSLLPQNKRVQRIIKISGIALALLLFLRIAVFSAIRRIEVLERTIPQKEEKLKALLRLKEQYSDFRNQLQALENRVVKARGDFDPTSWLKKEAEEVGCSITDIKQTTASLPQSHFQEKGWELNFARISLEQVTEYLYRIESQDSPVGIKRVLITKNPEDKNLLGVLLLTYVLIDTAASAE